MFPQTSGAAAPDWTSCGCSPNYPKQTQNVGVFLRVYGSGFGGGYTRIELAAAKSPDPTPQAENPETMLMSQFGAPFILGL